MSNTELEFYKNVGKKTNHENRKLLILDSRVVSGYLAEDSSHENVVYSLLESLIIDEPMDVYLEYLQFMNLKVVGGTDNSNKTHLEASTFFALDIPELKIKTYTNNQFLSNKFVIPNEIFGKTDTNIGDNEEDVNTYNIRLKSNYITTIQPCTIKRLTVSIYGNDITSSSANSTFLPLKNSAAGGGVKIALLFKKK